MYNKQFGYSYFLNKQKKAFYKKLAFINGILLITQISCGSLFFISLPVNKIKAEASSNLCSQVVTDIAFVIDRSNSMAYTSKCEWWELVCDDKPACTSYTWQQKVDYSKSQSWCDAKNQDAPYNSVWTEYNPTKMAAAKQAADNFLTRLGDNDQSALVSYANTASVNKALSNNHIQTQAAVDGLITSGATNIGDAIALANSELTSIRINASATQVMILLTDGKANKPNGLGSGEWPADVDYALAKANESAAAQIRIFTIGFGTNGEINETMLQEIANITGGKYFSSPTTPQLEEIFNLLKPEICEGSFCGDNVKNGTEECDGSDGVGEHQTCSSTCLISTLPYCGDVTINDSEQCDGGTANGSICTAPYNGTCEYCSNDCQPVTVTGPFCGDQSCNGDETCSTCSADCGTCGGGSNTTVCGNSVKEGSEGCDNGTANGKVCTASYGGTCEYCSATCQLATTTGPYCGDQNCNSDETCSTCSADCGACSSGGGGGSTTIISGGGTPPFLLGSTAHGYAASAPVAVKGESGEPDLKITKAIITKIKFANPGQKNIEYSVTVSNDGNLTAYGVKVKDILPAGLEYVDSLANSYSWDLGDIEAGKSKAVSYKINVNENAKAMVYQNVAEASATNFETPVKSTANLEVKPLKVLAETGFQILELVYLTTLILSLYSFILMLKRRADVGI